MTVAPDNWSPASDELAGKTILVTGATGGIGRAVSLACAAAGAEVLLQGRDDAALEALYDEILTLSGNTPGIVPLDLNVQDPTIYDTLRDELETAGTQLDGLIHNASVLGERDTGANLSTKLERSHSGQSERPVLLTRSLMPPRGGGQCVSRADQFRCRPQRQSLLGSLRRIQVCDRGIHASLGRRTGSDQPHSREQLESGSRQHQDAACGVSGRGARYQPAPGALSHHWVYLMSDASRHLHGQALSAQR